MRNSVSVGDGVYKSTDGGENWTNMGLAESEHIAKILIDPTDANTVYVCVPGKLWSDSDDRGVYKTTDGGKTWTKILAGANASTGCSTDVDGSVRRRRRSTPGCGTSGERDGRSAPAATAPTRRAGADCSRAPMAARPGRRSTTTSAKGLPPKPWGRVAVTVAPSKPNVVYAFIEAVPPLNALYRSDDGGATWEMRDRSQNMIWRPFYFANLIVDPKDENRVYQAGRLAHHEHRRRRELQRHRRRHARRFPRRLDRSGQHRSPHHRRRRRPLVLVRRRRSMVEGARRCRSRSSIT